MKKLLALTLGITLFTFIGCSQQKTEELNGTWINMEYKEGFDPENSLMQKVAFYPDGKFESYKTTSEANAGNKAVYKIEEKWTDENGNMWYKYRLTEKSWQSPDSRYLSKISDSGKILEYQFDFEFYPKKIDPSRLSYRKYNRE